MAEAIDFCDFYAAEIRVLGKPAKTQIMAGETNVQHWWPRGVGAVISPWNFPLAILLGMASVAVVGGITGAIVGRQPFGGFKMSGSRLEEEPTKSEARRKSENRASSFNRRRGSLTAAGATKLKPKG